MAPAHMNYEGNGPSTSLLDRLDRPTDLKSRFADLGPSHEEQQQEQQQQMATMPSGSNRLDQLLDTPLGVTPDEYQQIKEAEARGEDVGGRMDVALESSLKDRFGTNRLYLLEKSGTVITRPDIDYSSVDLDFSYLEDLDTDSPVRDCALHLSGYPVQNLSTEQVFSYVAEFAPRPVGIEWISDTRLCIVYNSPQATKKSLELLAKTGFNPFPPQNDNPLELRSAHNLPEPIRRAAIEAYTIKKTGRDPRSRADRDQKWVKAGGDNEPSSRSPRGEDQEMGGAVADSLAGQTQPAIEGEQPSVTDQNQIQPREEPESKLRMDDPEIEHPPPSAESLLPEGLHLEARLDIRYAVESDVKSRTRAKDSKWYAVHGKYAGKQGAQRPLDHMLTDRRKYGRYAEGPVDDGWGGREARRGDGGGGRRRRSASPSRRPRRHQQTADDLDRELDAFQSGEPIQDPSLPMSGGMAADRMEHHHQGRRSRYGRDERGHSRKGRQGRARQEDLDAELDAFAQNR